MLVSQPQPTLSTVCASSWASPLSLPFWLSAGKKAGSKVRLEGTLDALYLEHSRLVLQAPSGDDLVWVMFDDSTRFVRIQPDQLRAGQKLQVDGWLQSGRLQASQIRKI